MDKLAEFHSRGRAMLEHVDRDLRPTYVAEGRWRLIANNSTAESRAKHSRVAEHVTVSTGGTAIHLSTGDLDLSNFVSVVDQVAGTCSTRRGYGSGSPAGEMNLTRDPAIREELVMRAEAVYKALGRVCQRQVLAECAAYARSVLRVSPTGDAASFVNFYTVVEVRPAEPRPGEVPYRRSYSAVADHDLHALLQPIGTRSKGTDLGERNDLPALIDMGPEPMGTLLSTAMADLRRGIRGPHRQARAQLWCDGRHPGSEHSGEFDALGERTTRVVLELDEKPNGAEQCTPLAALRGNARYHWSSASPQQIPTTLELATTADSLERDGITPVCYRIEPLDAMDTRATAIATFRLWLCATSSGGGSRFWQVIVKFDPIQVLPAIVASTPVAGVVCGADSSVAAISASIRTSILTPGK